MTYGNRNFKTGANQGGFDERNKGVLFPEKTKRSDKSPDYTGHITLDDDVLNDIIAKGRPTGLYKIRLAGWKNTSQQHGVYLSLKSSKDEPRPQQRRSNTSESRDERKPWE